MVLGTVVISGESLRTSTGNETWLTIATGDGSQGAKLRTCIVFTVRGLPLFMGGAAMELIMCRMAMCDRSYPATTHLRFSAHFF